MAPSIVHAPDTRLHAQPDGTAVADTGAIRATLAADLTAPALLAVDVQGYNLHYGTANALYVATDGTHQIMSGVATAPLEVHGSVARYAPSMAPYVVAYEMAGDRAKRHVHLLAPLPPPDPLVFGDKESIYLAVHGPLSVDHRLNVVAEGEQYIDNLWTAAEIRLLAPDGSEVMHLGRIWAKTNMGHVCAGRYRLVTDPLTGNLQVYELLPWWWLRTLTAEDYPVDIDPTVVATSTSTAPTAYPNQKKAARFNSNGVLFGLFQSASDTLICRYSADGGNTWQTPTSGGTVGSYRHASGVVAPDDRVIIVARDNLNDRLVLIRGTPDAGRTGYTWTVAISTGITSPNVPDLDVMVDGSNLHVFIVAARDSAPSISTWFIRATIDGSDNISFSTATQIGATYAGSSFQYSFPSITRDGTTLAISWTTLGTGTGNGVRYLTGTIGSGGTVTWGTEEAVTEAAVAAQSHMGRVHRDNLGRSLIAFRDTNGLIRVFRRPGSGAWTDISPASTYGNSPVVITDGADSPVLLFANTGGLVYLRHTGAWSTPIYLAGSPNLLTANQSNVETNTTGFTALGSSIARDTIAPIQGSGSLKIVTNNTGANEGFQTANTAASASRTYVASLKLKGSGNVRLWIKCFNSGGSFVAGLGFLNITLSGTATRHSVAFTTTADTAYVAIAVDTTSQQAATFYADELQLEEGIAATTWAAGGATATVSNISVMPELAGSTLHALFTTGTVSPYSVQSASLALNQTPNEPTITCPVFDAGDGAPITLRHNDPDGDTMSGVYLKLGDQWWNGSALVGSEPGSPIAATGTEVTLDVAGIWTAGQTYQLTAATVDASGAKGPYNSTPVLVKASTKPVVTVTSPTNGATISSSRFRVQASQTVASGATPASYTVTVYDAVGTTPLFSETYTATGALDVTLSYEPANATDYQIGVRGTDSDGLSSAEVKRSVTTAFTLAATPVPTITSDSTAATVLLEAANPAPGVGQPTVTAVRFERTIDGGVTVQAIGTAAPDGTGVARLTDYSAPALLIEYRAIAIGDNDTETATDWQAVTHAFDHWRFIPRDGSSAIAFAYNTQVSWRPEDDVLSPQTQSRYRREYRAPTYAVTADIAATFAERDGLTARQWRSVAMEYARTGIVGYLKSPQGDVWRGTLRLSSVQPNDSFQREILRLTFRQTGGAP